MENISYSLIIPVYMNEESLPELLEQCTTLNEDLNKQLEVVFVVDGSPDNSFIFLKEQLESASFAAKLLLHSRNYGSFPAIRSGLEVAEGKYFSVMAADLQEPISMVHTFFTTLEQEEYDVVIGTRETREDPLPTRLASAIFWALYRRLIIKDMPKGGVDVFGCNTNFRENLLLLKESHGSLIGLIFWLGFNRKEIPYHRIERKYGKSAWTFKKKLNYLMDSIFSFSDLPIRVLLSIGITGLLFSLAFFGIIIFAKLSNLIPIPGYAATVTTILFFGGLNTLGIGLIGSYVWRAYANTQNRPLSVVMKQINFKI